MSGRSHWRNPTHLLYREVLEQHCFLPVHIGARLGCANGLTVAGNKEKKEVRLVFERPIGRALKPHLPIWQDFKSNIVLTTDLAGNVYGRKNAYFEGRQSFVGIHLQTNQTANIALGRQAILAGVVLLLAC